MFPARVRVENLFSMAGSCYNQRSQRLLSNRRLVLRVVFSGS